MLSLILLPGLACDAALFEGQLPALQRAGHRVVVSDVHTRCETLPQMARTLLAEEPGPHVLIGCSMGGMLALEMQRQAPQRVQGIALLGSSARPDTPALIKLRTQACELFAGGRMDEVLGANTLFAFAPASFDKPGLVASYVAMIRRAGPEQLIRQNHAVMGRIDSRPTLPQVSCPVLVACGESDGLTTPEQSREMAALLPHARLEIVAGAGHMLTMEQPQRVADLLVDWLPEIGAAETPT